MRSKRIYLRNRNDWDFIAYRIRRSIKMFSLIRVKNNTFPTWLRPFKLNTTSHSYKCHTTLFIITKNCVCHAIWNGNIFTGKQDMKDVENQWSCYIYIISEIVDLCFPRNNGIVLMWFLVSIYKYSKQNHQDCL